jgi:anti-sigma factor RsiW
MNCREAHRELALLAGDDLGDQGREAEIRQHLAECPACRRRQNGMKSAISALAVAIVPSATYDAVPSLWPVLRRRITRGDLSKAGSGWASAGPAIAGLGVSAGLMVCIGLLLKSPHPAPESAAKSPPAAVHYNYTQTGGFVEQTDKKPDPNEPAKVRGSLSKSLLQEP